MAQHQCLAGSAQALQSLDAGGRTDVCHVLRGHLVQNLLRLRGMGGTAGKGLTKSGQGFGQGGQHAGADAVAGEAFVGVAGVFDPAMALALNPRAQGRAGHRQKRPVPIETLTLPMRGHAGQAGQARATRQGDQQSFHLVVGMLGECDAVHLGPLALHCFGQSRITCFAGSVFGALALGMARLHLSHGQRHVQLLAQRSAMRFKRVGR